MTPSRFRLSAAGMTLFALAPLVSAADKVDASSTPDPEELDTVVVQAVREPGNFRIDRKEIQLTQASDLSDLLSNESGVAVGGGKNGHACLRDVGIAEAGGNRNVEDAG